MVKTIKPARFQGSRADLLFDKIIFSASQERITAIF
jgi:hypothetical protein